MKKTSAIRGMALLAFFLCLSQLNAAPTITVGDQTFEFSSQMKNNYVFLTTGEDPEAWKQKVTVTYYGEEGDDESLRNIALNYRKPFESMGKVLKALQISDESQNKVGYMLVAMLKTGDTSRAVMLRTLKGPDGAASIIYERQFAGEAQGDALAKWFEENGWSTESAMKKLTAIPAVSAYPAPAN